jgi:hypothetical protein
VFEAQDVVGGIGDPRYAGARVFEDMYTIPYETDELFVFGIPEDPLKGWHQHHVGEWLSSVKMQGCKCVAERGRDFRFGLDASRP